jgi:4-hydroxythreonine-4-phosphate dehydrogenase
MATPVTSCLALTMGDPTGIGPELSLKAWLARQAQHVPPFIYLGDADHLRRVAAQLELPVTVGQVESCDAALATFDDCLPALNFDLETPVDRGRPSAHHVNTIMASLETAISLATNRSVSAIITNPIHKKTMWQGGFTFPGHTEYLAAKAGNGKAPAKVCMMLIIPGLRVVPVTIHMPLRDVSAALRVDSIVRAGKLTYESLARDFGLERPKLGIASLNPHGGEEDGLGSEERDIIRPAIVELCTAGIDATGPFAADALFSAQSRRRFDAILCMYHDQALVPLKALDFERGVNVTLGLPFVRTSPDHGTAHDIAGKGIAKADSLIMALKTAHEIAQRRVPS